MTANGEVGRQESRACSVSGLRSRPRTTNKLVLVRPKNRESSTARTAPYSPMHDSIEDLRLNTLETQSRQLRAELDELKQAFANLPATAPIGVNMGELQAFQSASENTTDKDSGAIQSDTFDTNWLKPIKEEKADTHSDEKLDFDNVVKTEHIEHNSSRLKRGPLSEMQSHHTVAAPKTTPGELFRTWLAV